MPPLAEIENRVTEGSKNTSCSVTLAFLAIFDPPLLPAARLCCEAGMATPKNADANKIELNELIADHMELYVQTLSNARTRANHNMRSGTEVNSALCVPRLTTQRHCESRQVRTSQRCWQNKDPANGKRRHCACRHLSSRSKTTVQAISLRSQTSQPTS